MAALLNSLLSNTDQVVKLINECREKAIRLLPPDVNASDKDFTVVERQIRFGLGAVKNVGEAAIEVIIASRERQGPFHSLYDFCERLDTQRVNRRVIEQLIKCGAFDTLHPQRAQVLAGLDQALERAQLVQKDRQSGQINMFTVLRSRKKGASLQLPEVPPWDVRQTLQNEKESIGFYISGHPLDSYAQQLSTLCALDSQQVMEKREGSEVVLCGVVTVIKELTTKKGERMAFLNLEDKEGLLEVVAFPEAYLQAKALLESDEPRVVVGTVQHDDKGSKVLADRILPLEMALTQTVECVEIHLNSTGLDQEGLLRLRHVLVRHPGDCRVTLHLQVDGDGEAVIAVNPKLQVNPTGSLFDDLERHFGEGSVVPVRKGCTVP
jgi:DNA polymerase-3 subunit alpha